MTQIDLTTSYILMIRLNTVSYSISTVVIHERHTRFVRIHSVQRETFVPFVRPKSVYLHFPRRSISDFWIT